MSLTFFKTKFDVYPDSINEIGREFCFMVDAGDRDQLCITAHDAAFPGKPYCQSGYSYTLSELNHEAAAFLRKQFPFCTPATILDRKATFGVGDRLGFAGPGHLRVFREYDVFPVLAQQSMRELTLTHRTMDDVIDSATFAVFRDGYRSGFGADGDHLKTLEEVRAAIECGCTMITLDCSNYIDNKATSLSDADLASHYSANNLLETRYLNRPFEIGPNAVLVYQPASLRRIAAVYEKAIDFISQVYFDCIAAHVPEINFEISIDETLTVTSPLAHYFVANELKIRGIRFATIAPRFSGEFQKGIDYIGDPDRLRSEVRSHNQIARFFGYKLSFHSGSDKFSVFPLISEETQGHFHVKTSGTNWLEAVRVIAKCNPTLFRKMYDVAAATFEENRKFYHVTPDLTTIPDVDAMADQDLPHLLDLVASRQVLHIGYGKILEHAELKDQLYHTLRKYRQEYSDALYHHIGRHGQTLGLPHGCCAR